MNILTYKYQLSVIDIQTNYILIAENLCFLKNEFLYVCTLCLLTYMVRRKNISKVKGLNDLALIPSQLNGMVVG